MQSIKQTHSNGRNVQTTRGIHLSHLDGLRGLAALYVVIYHAYQSLHLSTQSKELPRWLYHLLGLITFGQAAVAVFIVLSGYCLMMPMAQANVTIIRGGIRKYIIRRSWRILPPYFAALAFSLFLILAIPGMRYSSNTNWDLSLPAFRWDIIGSHLILFHNFNAGWVYKIDYPMWSVATEWQIYFIFPFLLLPVWRRFGMGMACGVAFAVGIIPHWLFHGYLDQASFEFVGLFAFGMGGAMLSFSNGVTETMLRKRISWGGLVLILLIPIVLFAKYRGDWDWAHSVLNNIMVGLATTCLLIYCARSLSMRAEKSHPLIVQLLQARPCIALGTFSYSLYLTHAPVLALVAMGANHFGISQMAKVSLSLLVAVPLSVIFAYLFFAAFERPFLVKRKNEIPAEVARDAALSPAP